MSQCCSFHNCPSSLLPMGRSDARPSAGSVRQSPLRLSVSLQGMNWRHSVARSMSAPTGFSQWAEAMLALEENRWGNFQCDHQFVDLTSYASSRYILHTRAAAVERSVIVSVEMHCHSENKRGCTVWIDRFCFSLLRPWQYMSALCKHAHVCPHVSCMHDGPPCVVLFGLPQQLFGGDICHVSRAESTGDGGRKDNAICCATNFSNSLRPPPRAVEDDTEQFDSHR